MRRFLPAGAALAALALLQVAVLGCDPPAPSGGAASAPSAAASASAATVAPAQSAGPAPDNLNAAELQKTMKCASDAKSGPCGVIAKFSSGCAAWSAVVPSGDGRWFGRGYVV